VKARNNRNERFYKNPIMNTLLTREEKKARNFARNYGTSGRNIGAILDPAEKGPVSKGNPKGWRINLVPIILAAIRLIRKRKP
jgi:hypothetical protein